MVRNFVRALPLLSLVAALSPATHVCAQNPLFTLDTIDVRVGSRVRAGGVRAVEVIDAARLAELPVRSVHDALEWMLSVDLRPRSPAQADLSVRGGSFEQVLVLVDGQRMSDPQTGHFDLDLAVPLDRIERIEVLKGAASAVHGADAFGGVVNIVTRPGPERSAATLRLEGGSFGQASGGVDAGAGLGAWRVAGGFSWDESDGHREGTDYRIGQVEGQLTGDVGGGRLTVRGGYGWRDFGAADFYGPFPSYEETVTRTTSARWSGPLADRLTLTVGAAARGHDDDFVLRRGDPAFYQNIHTSSQRQVESSLGIDLGVGTLVVGGEWAREEIESSALGNRKQDRLAAFGEFGAERGALSGQVGLRVDERDELGETFVSPSAAVAVMATPRLRLRSAASRAFRAPTWTDRYYEDPANIGTPTLEVETGWSYEAGADLVAGASELSATVFRRTTNDLIDWARRLDDPEARWETRNVESATFSGVEFAVDRVALGPLHLRAAAAFLDLDTEENAGFFSKSSLRPLTRTLTLGAGVELPAALRLEALARHERRSAEEQGELIDVRLARAVGLGEVWIDGTNLLDDRMPDITGFPVAGRAVRVGVRARIGS